MNAQHTPGPWVVDGMGKVLAPERPVQNFGPNGQYSRHFIVCQPGLYVDATPDEVVANARLIAAAPDLLEFAQWFVENCEGPGNKRAQELLAKAAGGAA